MQHFNLIWHVVRVPGYGITKGRNFRERFYRGTSFLHPVSVILKRMNPYLYHRAMYNNVVLSSSMVT